MIHTYIGIAYYKNKVNWTFYMTLNQLKSIFLDQSQAMSSSGFPQKNSLLMVDQICPPIKGLCFGGKLL